MVSRRKFFAIFLMMAMLLFLFQFSQVMRESWNAYTNNEYAADDLQSAGSAWSEERTAGSRKGTVPNLLFVGVTGSSTEQIVTQWCLNKKYKIESAGKLPRFSGVSDIPTLVVIDGAAVDVSDYLYQLDSYTRAGIPLFFASLPDVEVIRSTQKLQDILGIEEIPKDRIRVDGIRLFEGYLLGGEAIYKAQDEKEEEELQDLKLEFPWYVTGKGSKTYMVGMLNEKVYERERFPRVFWRNTGLNDTVYAVNGDYMSTEVGYGLLDVCLYEMSEYVLYPVVNAQNTLLVDFPDFSGADADAVIRLYSRDAQAIQQDIFWPSIYSMITRNRLKSTGFFMTQYDADTKPQAGADQVNFYLQQLNEVGAEAGRSLRREEGFDLAKKLEADSAFYRDTGCEYDFRAAYLDPVDETVLQQWKETAYDAGLSTLTGEEEGTQPLFSYVTEDVTFQKITHRAQDYSYSQNLKLRSLLTSIGYTDMLVDFHPVLWPKTREDSWEIYFDEVYSNISTYWSVFDLYDQTTLSQSDERVRTFLELDYRQIRNENQISLFVRDVTKDSFFLLRTHGEKIDHIENAEYRMLEQDAYLIHVQGNSVMITLEDSDQILHYNGPFGQWWK